MFQVIVLVDASHTAKNGNSASDQLERNIKQHFMQTARNTFARILFSGKLNYGYYYSLCPPDYFLQGFNGKILLCSKELHEMKVAYTENGQEECEQQICFPETEGQQCISGVVPMFSVCPNSYVKTLNADTFSEPCASGGRLYNDMLLSRGLSCKNSTVKDNICPPFSKTCGLILTKKGSRWNPVGLVCCSMEAVKCFLFTTSITRLYKNWSSFAPI